MTGSCKLLIFGGMALAAFGMLYGLQYALFVEHQTLDHMGGSLAQSFSAAASRNLAQSQIANFSSAESQIRDADIASEAANLTKAQVLTQTSIAALAQANSEPQSVLKLLQG